MPGPPWDDPATRAGQLYDQHGPALYRYALMLTTRPDVAMDVVHDVFRALMAGGAAPHEAAPYLWRAVRNRAYSALRTRRVRAEVPLAPLLEAADGYAADPALRLALEQGLRALTVEQREVVHLHAFEGRTFQEIADASDTSINTVASRYRYALGHLKTVLDPAAPVPLAPKRTAP